MSSVFLSLVLLVLTVPAFSQPVVVNEFLASNSKTNSDEDGDSSDWIELLNITEESVELTGFTLTDDSGNPDKWHLPAISVAAGEYALIWASGKNRTGDELHTNFRLSATGEFVGIYTPSGDLVDGFTFGPQDEDVSMARAPDGTGDFLPNASPTPGRQNKNNIPTSHAIRFSPASGFFNNSVTVTLESLIRNGTVRYTTDGSEVKSSSSKATEPIEIRKTTVIRARVFEGSSAISDDISRVYMIDYDGSLPVLSFALDEKHLFGSSGIFDNPDMTGRKWEKPVSVNFLNPTGSRFQINAGLRVHGGRSRRDHFPKISTRLYFRSDYGESKLRYPLFDEKDLDEFDRLVVHSGGSSDQFFKKEGKINKQWSLIRDPLNHKLWQTEDGIISASRPVVLFINGEVWGIYHLRERVDDFYLESNFGITDADLVRPNDDKMTVVQGDLKSWNEMFSFIKQKNLSREANYEDAQRLIDIDNFIDFFVFNIFAGNWDMPHTNIYMFRERSTNAKWRWVMWDTDVSFGSLGSSLPASDNTMEWATRDFVIPDKGGGDSEDLLWSTLILRKLLENDEFMAKFVNRFADMMNTTLHPDNVKNRVDAMASAIRPNIRYETDRWDGAKIDDWENGISVTRKWAENRIGHQRNHLRNMFQLGSDRELQVKVNGNGAVKVNSKIPDSYPYKGVYFANVSVRLEAVAAEGYVFDGWDGASSDDAIVTLELNNSKSITAHFRKKDSPAMPAITSFSPQEGEAGTRVDIVGTNFIAVEAVRFFGVDSDFEVVSETQMQAFVPDSAKSGLIEVRTSGGRALSENEFVVLNPEPDSPVITSFSPISGSIGTEVTVSGSHFLGLDSVYISTIAVLDFEVESESQFYFKIPEGAKSGRISAISSTGRGVSEEAFRVFKPLTFVAFTPTDDAYVRSDRPDSNFGSDFELRVRNSDVKLTSSYIKFNLTGVGETFRGATLRLFAFAGGESGGILSFANNNWNEDDITWEKTPLLIQPLHKLGAVLTGGMLEVDVSHVIAGDREYSFAILGHSENEVRYHSKEGLRPPELRIDFMNESPILKSETFEFASQKFMNELSVPQSYALAPAYPNPFNNEVTIRYALPAVSHVQLTIFNLFGQKVIELVQGMKPQGFHTVRWRGVDSNNLAVSSGIYFVKLNAGKKTFIQKLTLQK